MAEVAIIIKTFGRENTFIECIKSIEKYIDSDILYRLYIADDSEISKRKQKLYDSLKANGHLIIKLPENTAVTKSRNMLLNKIEDEKYILRMDDDFCFYEDTNLNAMIKVLQSNKKIGAVADLEIQKGFGKGVADGEINKWQGFIKFEDNKMIKKFVRIDNFKFQGVDAYKYAFADFTRNMILFKKEVFKDIKWDENIRFNREHEDLMLQLKESRWKLAFTPDSIHQHREDILNNGEIKYSKEKQKTVENDIKYFNKKWNISSISSKEPFQYKFKRYLSNLIFYYQNEGFVYTFKKIIKKIFHRLFCSSI